MATRLTDVQKDVSKLNRELERLDRLHNQFKKLQDQIGLLRKQQTVLEERRTTAGSNNLTFSWTNGTATVSWAAGFIRDHNGVEVHHVPAGSRVLTVNTRYWAGWNPKHKTMSFVQNLDTIQLVSNVIVICRIQTGNGGNGTAGGGGTDSGGTGELNARYNFV